MAFFDTAASPTCVLEANMVEVVVKVMFFSHLAFSALC